jgi:hypothetical protein
MQRSQAIRSWTATVVVAFAMVVGILTATQHLHPPTLSASPAVTQSASTVSTSSARTPISVTFHEVENSSGQGDY